MNILDHINAGHYPKDEKGRSLVPMRNGRTATIYATDYATHPDDEFPLLAGYGREPDRWRADGRYYGGHESDRDLLPPPPRRIPEVVTLCIRKGDGFRQYEPGDITSCGEENKEWQYVLLKGEREEPWS